MGGSGPFCDRPIAMHQTTLPLQPTNPLRGMSNLAKQIALPHEYAPERFPSFPALERTAVMGFNSPFPMDLPKEKMTKVMLARQASYPLWGDTPAVNVAYYALWQLGSTAGTLDSVPITGAPKLIANGTTLASNAQPGMTGCVKQPGYAVLGVDAACGPTPFVYCPYVSASSSVIITVGCIAAAGLPAGVISLRLWDSPNESRQIEVNFAGAGGNLSAWAAYGITQNCWIQPLSVQFSAPFNMGSIGPIVVTLGCAPYGASYSGSGATLGTWSHTAATAGTTLFLPLTYPAEFGNSAMPWFSTRTTAAAALFTNVTQVLNKSGTVLAGRVAPQVIDPFNVASSYITNLHPAEKAYLALETGLYMYVPPSTDMAGFWDYTLDTTGGAAPTPVYRLDNDSLVNVAYFSAPTVAEGLAVNVDWHIEFRTSSTLFQIGLSSITLEAFHMAQLALVGAGFFFENPEHKSVLSKVASSVARMGKAALVASSIVYPEVRAVTRGIKAAKAILLPSHPKPNVPATSAAASGITSKKPGAKKKKVKVKAKAKR